MRPGYSKICRDHINACYIRIGTPQVPYSQWSICAWLYTMDRPSRLYKHLICMLYFAYLHPVNVFYNDIYATYS